MVEADEIQAAAPVAAAKPSQNRVERVEEALGLLRAASPEVRGAAVVSLDGFMIASLLPEDLDDERVVRMASTLLGAGDRVATDLAGGAMDLALVRGREGYVLLHAIGAEAILVVLTDEASRLGLVLLDVRRRAAEIAKIL